MIDEDAAERALNFLAKTDENFAELYRDLKVLEKSEKRILAIGFCESEEKTAAAKDQEKYKTLEYSNWLNDYKHTVHDYELMKAKRERAKITIDFWRSLNANRRQG